MKAKKAPRLSDLSVDVVEFMFTEWLVRQNLFLAYKENFEKFYTNNRTFRHNLRIRLRNLSLLSLIGFGAIISTSFPFSMTPEGYDFWVDKSNLWKQFCNKFKSDL